MNPELVMQLVQKGFHVALGATTSMVESLQDAQKRDENVAKLNSPNWVQLTDELAVKGAKTEEEARAYVNTLFATRPGPANTASAPSDSQPSSHWEQELQDLTAQVAAMRQELEQLRQERSAS